MSATECSSAVRVHFSVCLNATVTSDVYTANIVGENKGIFVLFVDSTVH